MGVNNSGIVEGFSRSGRSKSGTEWRPRKRGLRRSPGRGRRRPQSSRTSCLYLNFYAYWTHIRIRGSAKGRGPSDAGRFRARRHSILVRGRLNHKSDGDWSPHFPAIGQGRPTLHPDEARGPGFLTGSAGILPAACPECRQDAGAPSGPTSLPAASWGEGGYSEIGRGRPTLHLEAVARSGEPGLGKGPCPVSPNGPGTTARFSRFC